MRLDARHVAIVTLACLGLTAVCGTAHAQDSVSAYVGGGVIGDIKRFSGEVADPLLDGEAVGVSVHVGTTLHPRWDLQLGVDVPRFTTTSRERNVTFQRRIITLRSVTDNRTLSVATLVRYRGATFGRLQLGYVGGLSFLRFRRNYHTDAPEDTPAALIPRPDASVAYAAAPTLGLDARIDLSSHLSVVPAVHTMVFRVPNESGVMLRPRVSLRWTF